MSPNDIPANGASSTRSPLQVYTPLRRTRFNGLWRARPRVFPPPPPAALDSAPTNARADAENPPGAPDLLQLAHRREEEFERSERVASGEQVVPSHDSSETIVREEPDWLAGDADVPR